MSEWQQIETAPKDGTRILIYCPELDGVKECIAHYYDDYPTDGFPWVKDHDAGYIETYGPTHWMPLPEPPK